MNKHIVQRNISALTDNNNNKKSTVVNLRGNRRNIIPFFATEGIIHL